jgi:hypothetical protein
VLPFDFTFTPQVDAAFLGAPVPSESGGLLFLKLVQSEEYAYHHSKDLESRYAFKLEIHNETAGVRCEKRLFFNKQALPVGFVDVRIGDKVSLEVSVSKSS